MTVIGITGPTGAGKTTVLNELEKIGGAVIDCDAVYHELLESDKALQGLLIHEFGWIQNETGGIDRKKLGAIVFNDPARLEKLNQIVHHAVTAEVERRLTEYQNQKNCLVAAIDAIGLIESGLDRLCDATLAVVAPAEVRIKRIMMREGISEAYARSRVEAQQPDEFYVKHCQYTLINNDVTQEKFTLQAGELLGQILG